MSIDASPPPPSAPPDASPPPEPIDQPTLDNAAEQADQAGMEDVAARNAAASVDQVETIDQTDAVGQGEAAQTRSDAVELADPIDQPTVENASELESAQAEAVHAADQAGMENVATANAAAEEVAVSEVAVEEVTATEERGAAEPGVESEATRRLDEVQADVTAERVAEADMEAPSTAQAEPESGAEKNSPGVEPAADAQAETEAEAEPAADVEPDAQVEAEQSIESVSDQLLNQAQMALTDSPIADVLPPGAGLAIPAARAAEGLWQGRELIASDAEHAAAEMVRFVYGEGRDPYVEMRVNELNERDAPEPIEWQSFEALRDGVDRVDIGTDPDTAIFYGGRDPVFHEYDEALRNRAIAESYAVQTGKTTLEMTAGGAWLEEQLGTDENPNPNVSQEQRKELWDRLSERYAENASGEVLVFHRLPNPSSVSGDTWQRVELPTLLANPRVGEDNIRMY